MASFIVCGNVGRCCGVEGDSFEIVRWSKTKAVQADYEAKCKKKLKIEGRSKQQAND